MKDKVILSEETPDVEEKKKGKEEIIIKYGFLALAIILGICIIAFAAISLLPSSIISVGDEKIMESEFDYHYFEQANMLYQQVLEYYPDVSMQVFMLSEYQSGMTYHEFAKQLALERIAEIHILMDMAEQESYIFDEIELKDSKDNFKMSFQEYADQTNVSLDDAAKDLYGCKFNIVMTIYEKTWISSKYQDDMIREMKTKVEDDQTIEYYAAYRDELDQVTLKQLFITTYDREINSPFDDIRYEEAKTRAAAILERIDDGEDYDALVMELSEDPSIEETLGEYTSKKSEIGLPELAEWAFSVERNEGDIEMVETQIGFHITKYISRTEYDDVVATVRDNIAYGMMLQALSEKTSLPEYEIGYYKAFSSY